MSLDNFIPTVWGARLLYALQHNLVAAQPSVINRDYEGDIAQRGDTVKINGIGDVTVFDYTKNTDMPAPQALSDAQTELRISEQKAFNFAVDDVDRAQQVPKVMDAAMTRAAYALRNIADQFVLGHYTDISAGNFIGTDAGPKTDLGTAGKAYEYLVDLGSLLTDNDVPLEGRWAIVPPWFQGALLKDDRFVRSFLPEVSRQALLNGQVGEAAGFAILVSQNVPSTTSTTSFKITAGHPIAWTYAEQINAVEGYRPPLRFADAVKGLHLYGARVTRASALAVLFANRA